MVRSVIFSASSGLLQVDDKYKDDFFGQRQQMILKFEQSCYGERGAAKLVTLIWGFIRPKLEHCLPLS